MVSKTVKVSDIRIPQAFAKTTPGKDKVKKFKHEYEVAHCFSKKILVTQENLLVDGYAKYIALKELEVESCKVEVLDFQKKSVSEVAKNKEIETMYVFGIHPTSHTNKEYMWRVPNRTNFVFFKGKIQQGDMIFVHTKYGVMPVTVTRIERRPIQDETVKTVAKNKIMRGGDVIGN